MKHDDNGVKTSISKREMEVMEELSHGLTEKEIGEKFRLF